MRNIVFFTVLTFMLGGILLSMSGCESCNTNSDNKRFWYPSFEKPGYLDESHEYNIPNGSDPYMDATIGPRGMQARPNGYDLPVSRTTQSIQTYERIKGTDK
ncbi:MAG: hypothetical protein PHQ75_10320 [Thermoguttaceae bacterium]|nr:hypothetical protein [Thermoguttaceae bacterium]